MDCSTPGFPVLHYLCQSLLKLMSIESVMPSNHRILCHLLLLLPSIFPSIRIFSNELALWIRWPKYWSFSFSLSHSNDYSGLISFYDELVGSPCSPGTLKSLLHTIVRKHQGFRAQLKCWSPRSNKKKSMTTVAGREDSTPWTENSAADNLWPPLLRLRRAFITRSPSTVYMALC